MKTETYIGCSMCGIKQVSSLYPDCRREAKKWGIKLASESVLGDHVWTENRIVPEWYGKSIIDIVDSLPEKDR